MRNRVINLGRAKSKYHECCLRGGPWDKLVVLIPETGTMVIKVKGMHGFYDSHGLWQEKEDGKH